MLPEADQQLFMAVRKAQVNRNTAIWVFDNYRAEAAMLLQGGLVRVLLELPASRNEDYALARVMGTVEGAPYRGFSTNSNQESTLYLVLSLPRQLADLNGEQFQLNSVSNSAVNEAEFARWLQMLRADGMAPPSLAELEAASAKVQPLDNARRAGQASRVHRSGGGGASRPSSVSGLPASPAPPSSAASTVNRFHGTSHAGAGGDGYSGTSASSLPPAAYGGTSAAGLYGSSAALPGAFTANSNNNFLAGGGRGPLSSSPAGGVAGGSSAAAAGLEDPRQRQLARHGPTLGRGGGAQTGNGVEGAVNGIAAGGGVALQSSTPAKDTEETEAERRLRQDVMNHLQTSCALFPRESSTYKLSQLRTAERDMIEYLEHVREEIASKQENCVVCLDHLPTVILLPCKHKVLCRLCASTQANCPMCRVKIEEMFEPQEI